jgi:hypothetical protein
VGATILPVSEKAAEGQIEVYHHAVTWLVSRRDVVTPHLFAKRFQHPVRPRRERPTLHEFWFKGEGGKRPDLRTLATVWRYAWLTGDEAFDAEIEALGRRIATAGDLRIIELHEP